jgi:hypothetical protein
MHGPERRLRRRCYGPGVEIADDRASRRGARYPVRAAAVAVAWALGAVPAMLGLQRCPSALLLHRPCPGCGMTRAAWMLLRGDVHGSIAMHPLAIPTLAATLLIALAMVRVTFVRGAPSGMVDDRLSRGAVVAFVAIQIASVALWVARMLGALGGPVAV